MAKILITGGTGYIGSHTCVELIKSGYEVIIIDNLSNSDISVVDRIEEITGKRPRFHKVEMCDKAQMRNFFEKEKGIEAVIHFAAFLQVHESMEQPLKYYENNLLSLIHLLQCMEQFHINPIVFSSSCTVYGNPGQLPVNEQAPVKKAESPYGHTKQIGEEILEHSAQTKNLRAISLRYFNPVGAHESALIGEVQHGAPHHLVPYITETARGLRKELHIFGKDYKTHDGTCVRDYIHVMDVAGAHISALKRLLDGKNKSSYEVFNIGTGMGYSVLDVIMAFEKATGIPVPYQITARRKGDVEAVYSDTSLARQELGWQAIFSLQDMLQSAWQWEQKQVQNSK